MSAPTAVLTSSDNNPDFGISVCVNGDTVVVGSDGYFSGSPGSAYVFVKPAGGWHSMTETAKLTSSDGMKYDLFGYSVSASGQTIVVGAPQFGNILNPGPGKAYVFIQPSGGWVSMTQTAELDGSDSVNKDAFGFSVAVDANVVVAGAYVHNKFLGEAYVYQKPVSGWTNMTQTASLTPADSAIGEFGYAVAISGKIVVIGLPVPGTGAKWRGGCDLCFCGARGRLAELDRERRTYRRRRALLRCTWIYRRHQRQNSAGRRAPPAHAGQCLHFWIALGVSILLY